MWKLKNRLSYTIPKEIVLLLLNVKSLKRQLDIKDVTQHISVGDLGEVWGSPPSPIRLISCQFWGEIGFLPFG